MNVFYVSSPEVCLENPGISDAKKHLTVYRKVLFTYKIPKWKDITDNLRLCLMTLYLLYNSSMQEQLLLHSSNSTLNDPDTRKTLYQDIPKEYIFENMS